MFKIDFNVFNFLNDKEPKFTILSEDYDEIVWNSYPHIAFKLLDGDDYLYYYGRLLCDKGWEHKYFEPLDDFGRGSSGCTSIEYYNRDYDIWEQV